MNHKPKLGIYRRVALGLMLASLGIWSPPRLLAGPPVMSGEKEEAFDYYQDGKKGGGLRRVLILDLGDGITMELVRIPAGRFQMGSPPGENERLVDEVQHSVEITRDFYLGKYEVTRGQFRAFVKDTGYRTERETNGWGGWGYDEKTGKIEGVHLIRDATREGGVGYDKNTVVLEGGKPKYTWKAVGFAQTDEHPVVNVTWNDANAFCHWLGQRTKGAVRLPSEAEWEYACRAGSAARFYSGNEAETLVKVGNVADGTAKKMFEDWDAKIASEDGYLFTSPVGKFLPNRFGIYDMLGNVWEWCQDWYGPYEGLSVKDPMRVVPIKEIPARVMRGGGFGKRTPRITSAARRVAGAPVSCDLDLGFRVSFRPD